MKNIFLFLLTAFIIATGCDSGKEGEEEFSDIAGDSVKKDTISEAQAKLANQVIKSIPQPVEMAALIKETGADYNRQILNNPDEVDKYKTNFRRSFNLGVYGADLGYINLYNQRKDALNYLRTVTLLSEELQLGQFFDSKTLRSLANESGNLDSMVNITTRNFEKMNEHLQKQNRSQLSMYMLAGGWLEALYIATNVAHNNDNDKLMDRIGEQKVVLDQLLLLLSFYENDKNAVNLRNELKELKKVFDKIKIKTTYKEPTTKEKNGMVVVVENSKTKVSITKSHISSILNIVKSIRKGIIS